MKGNKSKPKKVRNLHEKAEKRLKKKQVTEEKLQHSAKLWQVTFDAIPDMVSIQDKDFRLVNVNKAYEQAFNLTRDDLKGKKCFEIVHQSNCPIENCPHRKTLETKRVVREEIYEPRLGVYLEIMTSPLFDENGELFGSVHVAKDITAKKETQEALRKSEESYRSLIETSPDAIMVHRNNKIIYLNPAARELFGNSRDEGILGKLLSDIVTPEYYPMLKVLNSDNVQPREIKIIRMDGSIRDCEISTTPYKDSKGAAVQVILHDITERKLAEKALRESEELLRKIAENFPNSYLSIIEKDFTVSFSSGQEFKKQNLDPELFTGLSVEEIFVDNSALILEEYRRSFEGEERSFELFINNQHQLYRTVPLVSEDGSINRILTVVENITERKQEEEESKKLLHDKVERVKELQCMYGVAESIRTRINLEKIFQDVAELIPPGWHYPEISRGRVTFDGKEYVSEPFTKTDWKQSSDIIINDEPRGSIEVYYLKECPELDEGPFMKEERNLINGIASSIGEAIERKLAVKKLQESEDQFRILTEAMPQIVWSADNKGTVDFYNEKAYEFKGVRKGDIEKLNWNFIIHPDEQKETISKWNEAITTGKIFRMEQRLQRVDGEYRWHLTRGVPVLGSKGEVIRWIGTATDIHEQKSHEEILEKRVNKQTQEIRKANKYNRSLLEASLDSLVTIGPDGIITDANKAAELIIGIERNELIGTDFSSYFTEPEKAQEVYLKVFSDGKIEDHPLTIRHVSGEMNDVLYNASVYRNESGQVEGVFAAAHDITEIKKAEQHIRREAEHQYAILSTTPDGFWVVDKNGIMISVNEIYLKMSGYLREEFLNLSIPDVEAFETPEETARHIKKIIQTGFDRFETKHKRKDGSIFNVEISASYLKTADQFIVFVRDITKRKEAEEGVEKQRKRFNDVLEMLPAFVVLLTSDYNVHHSNRFFINRFGEDKSKHCYELLNNLNEPCENCMTYMVLNNNQALEWEWKGPDGRNYYIYDFPFTDVDGTKLILKMGVDITELKNAEKEVTKLNEELEKRVQRRTAELMFANQELEAFSYSVSHDLRTPLSAIDGFSKVLHRDISDQLNDEYKEYLNRIISASDKMSNLITGLLNLSRISGVELQSKDVQLDLIATEIINSLKKSEPSRKVNVTIQPDILINADSEFVTIVMENLINNAWKFTSNKKEAKIKIGTREQNGDTIYFVKDNGVGFEMNDSKNLFTPFQRLHNCKKFEGSGIGLATVKRIIDKHGGRVWAESEINKGTSFYFRIPK